MTITKSENQIYNKPSIKFKGAIEYEWLYNNESDRDNDYDKIINN